MLLSQLPSAQSPAVILTTLSRTVDKIKDLSSKELDFDKRRETLSELQSIESQMAAYRQSARDEQREIRNRTYIQDRSELLDQPPSSSPTTIPSQDKISNSLQNSHAALDQYIDMSSASLSALKNQGTTLKSTRKKLLDVVNSVGLSQDTIKWIEKRSSEDFYIFYGGCCLVLLVMVLCVIYLL